MESLNIVAIACFSILAYVFGYIAGKKTGYIEAIKEIPVTVLEFHKDLSLREVKNEKD